MSKLRKEVEGRLIQVKNLRDQQTRQIESLKSSVCTLTNEIDALVAMLDRTKDETDDKR